MNESEGVNSTSDVQKYSFLFFFCANLLLEFDCKKLKWGQRLVLSC